MAVGAPQVRDLREGRGGLDSVTHETETVDSRGPTELDPEVPGTLPQNHQLVSKKLKTVRTAAPPAEDLLGYYIFTTYHLLLKEIRNEAGDTEIVALKSWAPPPPRSPSPPIWGAEH